MTITTATGEHINFPLGLSFGGISSDGTRVTRLNGRSDSGYLFATPVLSLHSDDGGIVSVESRQEALDWLDNLPMADEDETIPVFDVW